jgi:hypothetical protein
MSEDSSFWGARERPENCFLLVIAANIADSTYFSNILV